MMPSIWICGPTAAGKSEVAMHLASALDGEIISVDSMQVYRGMDIGTGKASVEEQARIRHHLIDVVDLTQPFSVVDFLRLAERAEVETRGRGKVPIYCGGTGLYFVAMERGIGTGPAPDSEMRRALEHIPLETLVEEIREKDPKLWETMDRQNRRRVVRAVETLRISGRPVTELRSSWENSGEGAANAIKVGLGRSREQLVDRINVRVRKMFEQGLVEEVSWLSGLGLSESVTASRALGYRQILEMSGRSLDEMVGEVQLRTRQFAKRQMTWFRSSMTLDWVEWESGLTGDRIAARIEDRWRAWISNGTKQA